MGLRRNISASYASQGYITLVSIVTMPFYLRYLGAEAYGLVGFFSMLQAWFMLLDMGLTPTLARESARFHGGALSAADYRSLVRVMETLFFGMAVLGYLLLHLSSNLIAAKWLQVHSMPLKEVATALQIIAAIIALRWVSGLYRSIVTGAENLVWLANFGVIVATVRFVGVLLALAYVGATPTVFFMYQLAIAGLELVVLARQARTLVPPAKTRRTWREAFTVVRPLVGFSLSMAFTASVWVFVTQTDKLILSRILPLSEYGYFTLAVLVASGTMVVSGPVTAALLPRLARLAAEKDLNGLIRVYRSSTQFVVVVATSTSITMALTAESLLFAWTGDRALAGLAGPIMALYALGNALLAVSAFPYYLQYAKGDLRLHVIGNVLFVVLLIPLIIWSASSFGGRGAGIAWLAINVLYLFAWTPLVHRRLQPGLNVPWFTRDIAAVAAPIIIVGTIVSMLLSPSGDSRPSAIAKIVALFAIITGVGAAATSSGWARIRTMATVSTSL